MLVVDPFVSALPLHLSDFSNVELVELDNALGRADVVALLVSHHSFRTICRARLADKTIVDATGAWRGS